MLVIYILIGLILGVINAYIIHKNINLFQSDDPKSFSIGIVITTTLILTLLATSIFTSTIEIVIYVLFWSLLLVTAWIDFYTSTINVIVIYVVTSINTILMLIQNFNISQHLLGGLIGFAMYFLIYLASKAYYKREAFGFGDVILMGSIGIHLGVSHSLLVAFLSFYVALFFIIVMKIIGKKMKRQTEIPFGPYMCLAAFIVSIYGEKLVEIYMQIAFG